MLVLVISVLAILSGILTVAGKIWFDTIKPWISDWLLINKYLGVQEAFLSWMGWLQPVEDWGYREQRGVGYMLSTKIMMVDWDIADREDMHYTIRTREEAVAKVEALVKVHPSMVWKIYYTPNGVHAFLLSEEVTPKSRRAKYIYKALKGDSLYFKLSKMRNLWGIRVTPKVGREGDFVAHYEGYVWGTKGEVIPSAKYIMNTHDSLIRMSLL
jgi:hypothetical protein